MGSFHIDDDYRTFKQFLALTDTADQVFLSTAYFNPLDEYTKIITEQAKGQYHIMAASPQVSLYDNYIYYELQFLLKPSLPVYGKCYSPAAIADLSTHPIWMIFWWIIAEW